MKVKFSILVNYCFLICNVAFGQISFDHLTVANGLSQSTALSFCKDSRGYIWIGTRDGLNRYDARSIKIYKHSYKDTGSLSSSDYLFSLFEDRSKNLWVGTVGGLNRYIPETDSFEHILTNKSDPYSLSDINVHCIYQDHTGKIWVGTNNGLNMLSSPRSRKFVRFFKATPSHAGLAGSQIQTIFEDHANNLWIGTVYGLTKMSFKDGRYLFTSFVNSPSAPNSLSGNSVQAITEDRQHNLWVGTQSGGLNLYDAANSTFTSFRHDPLNAKSISANDVRTIMADNNGKLWIGTINGLNIYDINTKTFNLYDHDTENQNSLSNNSIKYIYPDKTGTTWIGTMYGGVNIVHPYSIPFKIYRSNKFKNSVSGNTVSPVIADAQDNLWIGTDGSGLNYFDKKSSTFTTYINTPEDKSSIANNYVKALYIDGENNLWIGYHQGGLDLLAPSQKSFKHFTHDAANPFSISDNIVSCILEDRQKRFWVGTSLGLNLFDKKLQRFRTYITDPKKPIHLSTVAVRCIYEDSKQNIWVGTTIGLNVLRYGDTAFTAFKIDERDDKSLKAGYINCITEDKLGNIWVGSYHGGLSQYLPNSNTFKTYTTANGLPTDNVLRVEQADDGSLWISTDNGLSKFDLKAQKFKTFTAKDGLPINEFNAGSSFKDKNGEIYFGTYNGLVRFNPSDVKESNYAAPVRFTGLRLFNEPVHIGDKTGLLTEDVSLTHTITFKHDQNIFSIDFTALNYNAPERNRFMYKLDGFEKSWNYVSIPSATYTNLPPGDYNFLVKGSNSDGLWCKTVARLHLVILPPLWKTWWAYLFYIIAVSFVLYLVIRFFRRQARLERDLYHEQLNHERQQEIYQLKVDFFTKISHEIRTPLTLILAPIEKLIDHAIDNQAINRQLVLAKHNTDRLLRLVNELLDFRKVDNAQMSIKVAEYDIVKFCRSIFDSFGQLATTNKIYYQFYSDKKALTAYFDYQQLEKVLYNVLANAFKFTPPGGEISIVAQQSATYINIVVIDNGRGISADSLPYIFNNFYQDKSSPQLPGWGIGLALAKNIMELHRGSISAESSPKTTESEGKTIFTITLLPGHAHFTKDELAAGCGSEQLLKPENIVYLPTDENERKISKNEKMVVLLVEDNEEVSCLVKEALADKYNVHECVNGAEGWETACKLIPDLIVSDVAMPVMDGLELCTKIKADDRTSHIPFIMLTAQAAQAHLIGGLKTGADAYITKPFSMQVLELNIYNQLKARQRMQQKYARQITLTPGNKMIGSPDELFLQKLMQIIETNMEDPEFDVLKLVKEIGMSQPVLYRKIKALTDLSIADFVKTTRLKQAAILLAQNKLGIAEIAYAVGFNDRKYFSKEFKKQFGKAPTEYINQNTNQANETINS